MSHLDDVLELRARVASLEAELLLQRRLGEQVPCFVWTTDTDLRLTSCAGGYAGRLAIRPDNLTGTRLRECFAGSEADGQIAAASYAALRGESVSFTAEWLGQPHRVSLSPLRAGNESVIGTLGLALDASELQRLEFRLGAAERRYRDLIDHTPDLVFTVDLEGRFTSMNRVGERLLGYDRVELLDLRLDDVMASQLSGLGAHIVQLSLSGRGPESMEVRLRTRTGEQVLVELRTYSLADAAGLPVAIQGTARDITQNRNLEEQLRQSQKMEAIGVLAGGIAHDFNNLLTGILGNAVLLKTRTKEAGQAAEAIHGIIDASERASQLTQQLLGFARRGSNQSVAIDVHKIIRSVAGLLSRTIDKRIRIITTLDATRAEVLGDAGQIYQAVLNLALNARDAMPSGGELRLSTRVDEERLVLSVRDTGVGIPESIRAHIFEPFFTTKEPDKGTGLGLAMVYGIVKNHNGTIRFETAEQTGTTFEVCLDLAPAKPAAEPAQVHGREPVALRGRILVIDDEPVVRRVLSRMLQELGFEVIGSEDSLEAIEFYRTNSKDIDLVILDLVMPKLGGKEVLARLRGINPEVRAILSTGYDREGVVKEILSQGPVSFLQKPYTMDTLATVVHRALQTASLPPTSSDPLHSDRAV
jgi:two-component system, cell cycle sensor histidine kinase and response regulator CckA